MSYLQFSVTDRAATQPAGEARVLELESGLTLEEIARLARAFARTGITRVRLAGGEPLLHAEVVAIVETFAHQPGIGVVAMTTEGVHLAQYAEPLLWAGLSGSPLPSTVWTAPPTAAWPGAMSCPRCLRG